MKIRYKKTGSEGHASSFNTHALAEVLVNFDDGGGDSAFISELDVLLPSGWKDMKQAFTDHDLVTDNYNTCFFPPHDEMERERGWRLEHVPSEPVGLSLP